MPYSPTLNAPARGRRPLGPRLRSGLAVLGVASASVLGLGSCDDVVPELSEPKEPAPATQPEPSEPEPTEPKEPTAGGGLPSGPVPSGPVSPGSPPLSPPTGPPTGPSPRTTSISGTLENSETDTGSTGKIRAYRKNADDSYTLLGTTTAGSNGRFSMSFNHRGSFDLQARLKDGATDKSYIRTLSLSSGRTGLTIRAVPYTDLSATDTVVFPTEL